MAILEVQNIEKSFDRTPVLKDISFSLEKGQALAIIGSSGSGKTTLLRCLNFLERPDKGKIIVQGETLFDAQDASSIKEKDIRMKRLHFGMVFQAFHLFPQYTALENVMLAPRLQAKERPDFRANRKAIYAELRAKSEELLARVGLADKLDYYPHQLSGGMRQRVVIAIALACNPDLLICDEPTTALDVTIQAKIIELIRRVQKERGISVIYITHDLGVVAKVADYVNVMYAGKIVEKGMINEIFYDPKHPYTWGLLSAMPDLDTADERLYTIPGSPPNLLNEKPGDAFAPRNQFALEIDDKADPPMFQVTDTHYAATWLLDPRAPKAEMPPELKERIARMKKEAKIDDGE